jgi:hypothetical protein
MAKSINTRSDNAYQKYFDPRSLKNVASSAAIIFLIVHLLETLCDHSISLRTLRFIILGLSLSITFLFVVNDLGRPEEKLILGIANAALLFFSVIGFNSTLTSDILSNPGNHPANQSGTSSIKSEIFLFGNNETDASLFSLGNFRAWMPPRALENQVDTLVDAVTDLKAINRRQRDSIEILNKEITTNGSSNLRNTTSRNKMKPPVAQLF